MPVAGAKSTQDFVPIKEVRDGVIVLKDGSLRAIIMTSSINFALKSEDNRAAIIDQFQNFLNSLDFSIQIFIESRKLDIKPYISLLEDRLRKQETELMKIQTREYIEFIKSFTEGTNIMAKSFFVVVPFGASVLKSKKGPMANLTRITDSFLKKGSQETVTQKQAENFEESKIQLQQRLAVVDQGLVRCGLRTVRLGSEELIELFYKLFNPGETEKAIQISG